MGNAEAEAPLGILSWLPETSNLKALWDQGYVQTTKFNSHHGLTLSESV